MPSKFNSTIFAVIFSLACLISSHDHANAADDKPLVTFSVSKQKENGEAEPVPSGGVIPKNRNYRVEFKTTSRAYIYIYQRDITCKLYALFPNPNHSDDRNPVAPNRDLRSKWISPNGANGEVTLIVLAYKNKLKNPEKVCQYKMSGCARGVAGTHKPQGVNMNIVEIREMRVEFR